MSEVEHLTAQNAVLECQLRQLAAELVLAKTQRFWLVFIWRDVEPRLLGPFRSDDERAAKARELYEEHGDEHGYFRLDTGDGDPEVDCYAGSFLEGGED